MKDKNDFGSDSVFIRPSEVCALLGVSRSHLEKIAKQESFPRKIKLSARIAGFNREAVMQWVEQKSGGASND